MSNLKGVLKLDGHDFKLTKGVLKAYVLQKYIDTNIAKIEGSVVGSLGLIPFRWYDSLSSADKDKPSITGTINIPSYINFYPQDVDNDKVMKIYDESYEKPYSVLTFGDGYKCFQGEIIRDLDNVVLFEETILAGRLDDNIPYNMLTPSWIMNMIMNDVSLHVPVTTLSTIVMQMCRDPKNPNKTFAQYIAKQKNPSMIGYRFANIRELSASSVFGGLSFEDFNYMADLGLSTTKEEKDQKISSIEDILKL